MTYLFKIFYQFIFPILLIFPTINLLVYFNIPMPQFTLSNFAIILFILISFFYKKFDPNVLKISVIMICFLLFSLFISAITLSSDALQRGFVSFLYFFIILLILISTSNTIKYLARINQKLIISTMLRNIGVLSLISFFIITLYQFLLSESPSLLSSNITIGYRDFGSPILDGATSKDFFRALGSFPEPSMYAGFIVVLLPLMKFRNKLYNVTCFFATIISVMLTFSRIGVILLFIYLFILFILSKSKLKYILVSLSILILLITIDFFYFNNNLFLANFFRVLDVVKNEDVSILTRIGTPVLILQSIDFQILIGYGLGGIVDLVNSINLSSDYLHFEVPKVNNFYLFWLLQFGLISFIFLMGFLFLFIYNLIRCKVHINYKREFTAFLLCLCYFFTFDHLILFYMFFLLFSLACFLHYSRFKVLDK